MNLALGCRICEQPLEPMEKINKISTRKPEKRPGDLLDAPQDNKLEPRPEHLDPHPMATRCGHIFHLGCVKRLISEKASMRIDCPTCGKPVVLAQLRSIKFYYPPKCNSTSSKIHRMNQENNDLTSKLAETKKLRMRKKYEYEVATAKVKEIKQKAQKREGELQAKVENLNAIKVDGMTVKEIDHALGTFQGRIMEMSSKNSRVLKRLESIVSQLSIADQSAHLNCLKQLNECLEQQDFTRIEHENVHGESPSNIVVSRHKLTVVGPDGKLNSKPVRDQSWVVPVKAHVAAVYVNDKAFKLQPRNKQDEDDEYKKHRHHRHHHGDCQTSEVKVEPLKETCARHLDGERGHLNHPINNATLKVSNHQPKIFEHPDAIVEDNFQKVLKKERSLKKTMEASQLTKLLRKNGRHLNREKENNYGHLNDGYFSGGTSTDVVSLDKMVILPSGKLGDYMPTEVIEDALNIRMERGMKARGRIKLASRGMKKYKRY